MWYKHIMSTETLWKQLKHIGCLVIGLWWFVWKIKNQNKVKHLANPPNYYSSCHSNIDVEIYGSLVSSQPLAFRTHHAACVEFPGETLHGWDGDVSETLWVSRQNNGKNWVSRMLGVLVKDPSGCFMESSWSWLVQEFLHHMGRLRFPQLV